MSTGTANCTNCGQALSADGRCRHCGAGGHVWTLKDWRPLGTLLLAIALGFSFTRLVVNAYDARRQELASEYYVEGMRALNAQQPGVAVGALESALIYSHDSYQYQLKLTDALLASGATSEAVDQLHSFLEQRPRDAQVNLKLARLEARRTHVDSALRYYLAAIEGDWPEMTDAFPQRIAVRFESAEYLLEQGRLQEADWALQALAGVLPAGWPQQARLGDLFLRAGDAGRALNVYEGVLSLDRDNKAALLGAAKASMATGSYASARHYLRAFEPPSPESGVLLGQLDRLESLDPFSPKTTAKERTQRTLEVFRIATERMSRCGVPAADSRGNSAGNPKLPEAKALEHWSELRKWEEQLAPMMNEPKLHDRDELIESTLRFAFQAEMSAEKECGKGSADDEALLLLARGRLGTEK